MTIIEKIKQSIEGATGFPFLYHAAGEINELLARCKSLPVAYSFLINSGTIDDVNGRYHERVTLAVMFCDKTEFDFNAIENEEIIDRMKVKAYKWLQSLRMSNALRVVSINNTQRLYDNTTDILTGFAVNITIDDVAGVGECELPEVVIDIDKNGSYNVVGIDKVSVNVVPKWEELEVTQNGEYLPPTDIDGFSKVSVDVQPVLEKLTITQNGEYTPQEGVDGFSKIVANIVPTKKVVIPGGFRVTNTLIIDGYWAGELVDTSKVIDARNMFYSCSQLQNLDVSNWDVSKVENTYGMFHSCYRLQNLDVSNWDVSEITDMTQMFYSCYRLQNLDVSNWDVSKVENAFAMFSYDSRLQSLIGNLTIDEVLANNIGALNGLKVGLQLNTSTLMDRASLRAVINGLADLTGETTQTLKLGASLLAKLTEEDIAIATNKNWTIV